MSTETIDAFVPRDPVVDERLLIASAVAVPSPWLTIATRENEPSATVLTVPAAVSIASTYHGDRATEANFPQMDIETEELRVFDASSGGAVQWYRSWCDGSFLIESVNDIDMWACATSVGQTEPSTAAEEHRIGSLSFLFGKK